MKNKLFAKTTALMMGSLIIFSGSALAMKSHNQEVTNAEALDEVELLIAQNGDEIEFDVISKLAVDAKTVIGNITGDLNNVAKSEVAGFNVLAQTFGRLETVVGDIELLSKNQALTKGTGIALAQQMFDLSTTVGNISATLENEAITEEGKAVASSAVRASTTLGDISLQIKNKAEATGS